MDRQIVWPGAIPLETDLLNTNRNTMVALAALSQALFGTTTLVSGLACTQTTVASWYVNIGQGSIYSVQNLESSAYSSLAADTTDQIVKQGILLASANLQLGPMAAPSTVGQSVIYLVEAAFSETDTNAVVLPYYNSSNPAVPYSGPANAGTTNYTLRKGGITVQLKQGVAATTGTQVAPATDSGFVPLYYITIAYGASNVVNANITTASGAPFINSTLFGSTPTAPTPASSDNSTKIATTAFVKALSGSLSGVQNVVAGNTVTALNQFIEFSGSSGTVTIPSAAGNGGSVYAVWNNSVNLLTLSSAVNFDGALGNTGTSITLQAGAAMLICSDNYNWFVVQKSDTVATGAAVGTSPSPGDNSTKVATTAFVSSLVGGTTTSSSSLAASGYQKLPSGLIIQWGTGTGVTSSAGVTVTFPLAFPTGVYAAVATAGSNSTTLTSAKTSGLTTSNMNVSCSYYNGSANTYVADAFTWVAIGH